MWENFSGLRFDKLTALSLSKGIHSFIFRLPYLLGPPTALTVKALCPFATGSYAQGRTHTVAGRELRHHYMSEPDN
jgi:hypothetical protein